VTRGLRPGPGRAAERRTSYRARVSCIGAITTITVVVIMIAVTVAVMVIVVTTVG